MRILNGKHGLHLVVLYIIIGQRRIPWSFRVWRGKGQPSPNQLACKLLASVPKSLVNGRTVIVQADTEFGTRRIPQCCSSAKLESSCRAQKLSSFARWPKAQRPSRQSQTRPTDLSQRYRLSADDILVLAQTGRQQKRVAVCRFDPPLFWRLPRSIRP